MRVTHTVRETSESRPTPTGDFEGLTRAQAMRDLLAQHDTPKPSFLERLRRRRTALWLLAGIIWVGPKLTPQQAADVLRQSPGASNLTGLRLAPFPAGVVASTGTSGPTPGPWTFPAPAPARRLDGTRLDEPVTTYGNQNIWPWLPLDSAPPRVR